MSAFGGKADIIRRKADIANLMSAFGGKADVRELPSECLLIARSGHQGDRRADDKLDGTGNPGEGLPV